MPGADGMATSGPGAPTGQRIKRGVFVMTASRIAQRVLGLLRFVVLTHWLSPADVGLVVVGVLAIDTLNMLTVTGLASAFIQRKDAAADCLDAVWTLQLTRALGLVVLAALVAPVVGFALEEPGVVPLIRALALMLLINGLSSGAAMMLRRDLDFGPLGIAQTLGAVADVIVTLWLVSVTHSPWAMVAGQLTQSLINAIASYIIHPYRPRLDFAWGKLRGLWRTGAWMGASHMLLFASRRADDLLVTALAGHAALAVYQPAFRLANLPGTEGTDVLAGVFFPAYSRLQADPARARSLRGRVLRFTALLTLPFAAALIVAGPWATTVLFGPEWLSMGTLLQILAVQGAIQALGETARPILFAAGKPRAYAALKSLHVGVFVLLGVPLVYFHGAIGAALATTAASLLIAPLMLWYAYRIATKPKA